MAIRQQRLEKAFATLTALAKKMNLCSDSFKDGSIITYEESLRILEALASKYINDKKSG
ncbi:MAG TPA: hypothetical protein VFC63_18780 [Blastocatellia bacterium]|nr:hypothetical protein [Blastocatellia bacterium]